MAAKDRVRFACSECGADAPKWVGQCPRCDKWQTMQEALVVQKPKAAVTRQGYAGGGKGRLVTLANVEAGQLLRMTSGLPEFDRVLGGGLVAGGSCVLGGTPGAGKSTLLLQSACHVAADRKVVYITGEESEEQIKDRAERLQLPQDRMLLLVETDALVIAEMIEREQPAFVVVDSIQTCFHPDIDSAPGGTSQVRTCAQLLNQAAKRNGTALALVGHINKNEALAGPQSLSHIVDAVLLFSSTDDARYRIMRANKNRHGPSDEIGVFSMTAAGLKAVVNPSAIFLSRSVRDAPGSVVTPLWEGSRPMLVEMQALADESLLSNPRRVAIGFDANRVAMLLAILHKNSNMKMQAHDIYVNVVGGVEVTETCADLPVLLAIASSFMGKIIPSDVIAFGEVGLSGEVRPSRNGSDRIREAAKLGFKRAVVPLANCPREPVEGLELFPVATLAQAFAWLETLGDAEVVGPRPAPAPVQAAPAARAGARKVRVAAE